MQANFLPAVPSWLILIGSLALLALATFYLAGRARLVSAPSDYDELRELYEPIVRLSMTLLVVGTVLGIVLATRLDRRGDVLHFGIAAGTGALAALGCLCISIGASPKRSWNQYRHYQDMYRSGYTLPSGADIWLLSGLVLWGIVELWAVIYGT